MTMTTPEFDPDEIRILLPQAIQDLVWSYIDPCDWVGWARRGSLLVPSAFTYVRKVQGKVVRWQNPELFEALKDLFQALRESIRCCYNDGDARCVLCLDLGTSSLYWRYNNYNHYELFAYRSGDHRPYISDRTRRKLITPTGLASDIVGLCESAREHPCALFIRAADLPTIPAAFRFAHANRVAGFSCRIARFGSRHAAWEPVQPCRCIQIQTRAADATSFNVDLFHGNVTFI